MQPEIEVKFLNIDMDSLRSKLTAIGAKCINPDRLMRRVVFDSPQLAERRKGDNCTLRIRDEGDKVTTTLKWFVSDGVDGAQEIETTVGSFNTMTELYTALGLKQVSFMESKRETWEGPDCVITLDTWPWLNTFIEIEGLSVEVVQSCAKKLGFDWNQAVFGDVVKAYRQQYPDLPVEWKLANLQEVKFDSPTPSAFCSASD